MEGSFVGFCEGAEEFKGLGMYRLLRYDTAYKAHLFHFRTDVTPNFQFNPGACRWIGIEVQNETFWLQPTSRLLMTRLRGTELLGELSVCSGV